MFDFLRRQETKLRKKIVTNKSVRARELRRKPLPYGYIVAMSFAMRAHQYNNIAALARRGLSLPTPRRALTYFIATMYQSIFHMKVPLAPCQECYDYFSIRCCCAPFIVTARAAKVNFANSLARAPALAHIMCVYYV
jgi:hypothetical protein